MFLFANIHLNLFIFWLVAQVSNHTTINIFFSHICRYVYICPLSYFPRLELQTMSEYVVPFIHIFSEKEKEPPKLAKSPQPPRAEKLYLQRKKIHQNSVTSRRSYLANLRQQMLLGKKLTPRSFLKWTRFTGWCETSRLIIKESNLLLIQVTHVS